MATLRFARLAGLGVGSRKRAPTIPDVPTLTEAGQADFQAASWVGFFVPSATDAAIVTKINKAINQILGQAAARQRLEKSGLDIMTNDTAETGKFFQSEVERWGGRVEALSLSLN